MLFSFNFNSNISLFLPVIASIAILCIHVSVINIPTPPPCLSSLIFSTHLYHLTIMCSFCFRFVSVTAYRSHSVEYTTSFNDFIFDFIPVALLYKIFSLLLVVFLLNGFLVLFVCFLFLVLFLVDGKVWLSVVLLFFR